MINLWNSQNISCGQIISVVASQHGGVQNVNSTRNDLSNELVETRRKLVGVYGQVLSGISKNCRARILHFIMIL